mmetsp:Transcript_83101/g.231204  ORF Transcript_83101/g.231204 Transcript_83101/m.231204 type:complete len:332 (-) Transcript_83101:616-1611(-)
MPRHHGHRRQNTLVELALRPQPADHALAHRAAVQAGAARPHQLGRVGGGLAQMPLRHQQFTLRRGGRFQAGRETLGCRHSGAEALGPGAQTGVVGQVHLQRRDRHLAIGRRMEVRAFASVLGVARRADPVDGFATRVDLLDDALAGMAPAQARDLARQLVGIGPVGDVDVQQEGPVQPARDDLLDHAARDAGRRVQRAPALFHLREGDRRDAEQIALGGRRDGARVQGVVAHVGAVVDARDHQVGPVAEQAGQCQVDTVRRRAADVAEAIRGTVDIERPVQRQRVGRAAGVLLGRDDVDLAKALAGLHERRQARREVAIVIGNQDAHGCRL